MSGDLSGEDSIRDVFEMLIFFAIDSTTEGDAVGPFKFAESVMDNDFPVMTRFNTLEQFFKANEHLYLLIPEMTSGVFAGHAGKSISSILYVGEDGTEIAPEPAEFISMLLKLCEESFEKKSPTITISLR